MLAAAGAEGETVTVQAMDGYAVEAPMQEMVAKGAVVALERDGKPLGIGGFGPTQIVFPRAERADLADMPRRLVDLADLPHQRGVGGTHPGPGRGVTFGAS